MAATNIEIQETPAESAPITPHDIKTEKCGSLRVYVQGELDGKDGKVVFLTVHDLGTNHKSILKFINHPSMVNISSRSVFVHVVFPGQDSGAPDLEDGVKYPSMQELGDDLVCVLTQLKIEFAVGLGEGAGANVLARFAMIHPTKCLGLILVHPTSTTAGVMEHFKDRIIQYKLEKFGHNPTAEQYLVFYKFGERVFQAKDKEAAIKDYKNELASEINPKNLRCFVEAFRSRTDISEKLSSSLVCDTLLLVGDKSSFLHTTETMYQHANKTKTSILRLDDVGDVLSEAPAKVSQSILLFCQGMGLLTSLSTTDRLRTYSNSSNDGERRPSMSMEDYDRPNTKRFSLGGGKDGKDGKEEDAE